jgi:hypothetical protein
LVRSAVVGAIVFAAVSVVGVHTGSTAPTLCAPSPTYGVGVAIIPEFVGTDDTAVTAYPGEVIDYDVTVFLKQDPPGTPNGVIVCPIFGGTLTIRLPDGSGPFTIGTNISLPVGGSVTFQNVPTQKYTMNPADVVPAPGCVPATPCPDRVEATAHIAATSEGPDDGQQDDAPVQATATAPTFLLAPSTQVTVTPNPPKVTAGQPVTWTVSETNDTPPKFFPAPLSDVHVDLSTDGGTTTFKSVDASTAGFSGDTNGDGNLDVGETWQWTFTTTPQADTTMTATGFGDGPRSHLITFPADAEERSAAPVLVTPTAPPPTPTAPPTSTPLLLPPTGASSPFIDASGIIGVGVALLGLVLVLITRRRGADT